MAVPRRPLRQINIRLPQDATKKLAIYCFAISVLLLIVYQMSLTLIPNVSFFEPDNFEYLLFSQRAIALHSLNVSNPYLININGSAGFFEHDGLYQVPVFIYSLTFGLIPLIWIFRLIYIIPILISYLVSLLIAKKILQDTPISEAYKYVAYTLVVLNYFLLHSSINSTI